MNGTGRTFKPIRMFGFFIMLGVLAACQDPQLVPVSPTLGARTPAPSIFTAQTTPAPFTRTPTPRLSARHATATPLPTATETLAPGLVADIEPIATLQVHALDPEQHRQVILNWQGKRFDWAPEGQALAFVREEALWLARAPTFRPQRLVEAIDPAHPVWSPQGRQIAFAARRASEKKGRTLSTIWVIHPDGSGLGELLPRPAAVRLGYAATDPVRWLDEQTLAFTAHCGTGCEELISVDVSTQALTYLLSHREAALFSAPEHVGVAYHWSPGRNRIAVDKASQWPQVILLDVEHRQIAALTSEEAHYAQQAFADWSPDGQRLLYIQWGGEGTFPQLIREAAPDLYLWNVETGAGQQLLPHVYQATWSPDGRRIAFVLLGRPVYDTQGRLEDTGFASGQPFTQYIGILDIQTRQVVSLSQSGRRPAYKDWTLRDWLALNRPVWSPDGKQVAYWGEAGDLWAMEADGTHRRQVTQGLTVIEALYSPEGSRLAIGTPDKIWIIQQP